MARPPIILDFRVQDQQLEAAIKDALKNSRDLRPAFRKVAGVLADSIEETFEKERDPVTGAPWADLRPETKNRRAEVGKWPGKKLQVTGQLIASFSTRYGKDFAVVGTNKEYAPQLHFGRNAIPRMVARPFLGVTQDEIDEITDIFRRHILGS